MNEIRILLVDDDDALRATLEEGLSLAGCVVRHAPDGASALARLAAEGTDLMILDLSMPQMDGVEVTRRARTFWNGPIIILTAHHQEAVKVMALDAGADDYVSKPVNFTELLPRIRAVLRRTQQATAPQERLVTVGALCVNLTTRVVTLDGQPLSLTQTEYRLLAVLASNLDVVMSYEQLLAALLVGAPQGSAEYIRVLAARVRAKLGRYGPCIEVVPRVGCVLHGAVEFRQPPPDAGAFGGGV